MNFTVRWSLTLLVCLVVVSGAVILTIRVRRLVSRVNAVNRWFDSMAEPFPYDYRFEKNDDCAKLYDRATHSKEHTANQATVLLYSVSHSLAAPGNIRVPGCRIVYLALQPELWVYRRASLDRDLCRLAVEPDSSAHLWKQTLTVTLQKVSHDQSIVCEIDPSPILTARYSQHWWVGASFPPSPTGPINKDQTSGIWLVWKDHGNYDTFCTLVRTLGIRASGYYFNQGTANTYVGAIAWPSSASWQKYVVSLARQLARKQIKALKFHKLPAYWLNELTSGGQAHVPKSAYSPNILTRVAALNKW